MEWVRILSETQICFQLVCFSRYQVQVYCFYSAQFTLSTRTNITVFVLSLQRTLQEIKNSSTLQVESILRIKLIILRMTGNVVSAGSGELAENTGGWWVDFSACGFPSSTWRRNLDKSFICWRKIEQRKWDLQWNSNLAYSGWQKLIGGSWSIKWKLTRRLHSWEWISAKIYISTTLDVSHRWSILHAILARFFSTCRRMIEER